MSNLTQLEKNERSAYDGLRRLVGERDRRKQVLMDAFAEATDKGLDAEYGERLQQLANRLSEAKAAVIKEQDRLAIQEPDTPYPVGTKMLEWSAASYFNPEPRLGKGVGVVEVCTSATVFPANFKYSKPRIGEWFIRLLDKKGNPTKRIVDSRWANNWKPEGVQPKPRKPKTRRR